MEKTILLASLIYPEKIDWFLNFLQENLKVSKDKIFGYEILNGETKIIITFKLFIKENERIDIKNISSSSFPIHKKGNALYTINALNKLIEHINSSSLGNIDYKSIKINWEDYQNKLIVINNKELTFFTIKRIF